MNLSRTETARVEAIRRRATDAIFIDGDPKIQVFPCVDCDPQSLTPEALAHVRHRAKQRFDFMSHASGDVLYLLDIIDSRTATEGQSQ